MRVKLKKLPLMVLILLALSQPISAKDQSQNIQTILPLQFNTGHAAPFGLATTPVIIQGKTLPLVFDTGASPTGISLTSHALKGITVHYTSQQECFKMVDGKHCQPAFIIPEVHIGTFIVKNVPGIVMLPLTHKGFVETAASRNGIIGYKLLSQFNVLLDYPNATATLVKPKHTPASYDVTHWIAVSFYGDLLTKLHADGRALTLRWDTGAVPSGMKSTMAANFTQQTCSPAFPFKKDHCMLVTYGSLKTPQGEDLAGNNWFQVQDIPSAPFDGLVGSNFYAKNLVYLDFDHQKIAVKPIPSGR